MAAASMLRRAAGPLRRAAERGLELAEPPRVALVARGAAPLCCGRVPTTVSPTTVDASSTPVYNFGELNKGDLSTSLTPSITTQANSTLEAVPIDELLSPSFLSLFDKTLPTSWTIWDHCLEALNAGDSPGTCIVDLISAFEPLLASNVIYQIHHTLGALEHSILRAETILIPSLKSVLENILFDLKERAYPPSSSLVGDIDVSQQRPRNESRGGGGPRRGGRGGKGRGRGSSGTGGGREGSVSKRDEQAQFFKDLICVDVNMNAYITPPKGNQEQSITRRHSIGERARAFAEHSVVYAAHIPYDPYKDGGVACLYHGTQLRMAHTFSQVGILPWNRNTEFSFPPAFYVTNDIAIAFEFPLHNRLLKIPKIRLQFYVLNWICKFCMEIVLLQVGRSLMYFGLSGRLIMERGKIFVPTTCMGINQRISMDMMLLSDPCAFPVQRNEQ